MLARSEEIVAGGVAPWAGFVAMCVGMFMAILDIQIVASSLPEIQRQLGIPSDAMSLLQTSYLIAEVIAIALTGWFTRLLGIRVAFLVAASLFLMASAGCAASQAFVELIAWRSIQGLAGGVLIPLVFSAAFVLFPVRQQPFAATIAGMLAVLAPTIGPLAGGWITSNWSWHWLFLINIAPGICALAIAAICLPRQAVRLAELAELNIPALLVLAAALAVLEIGLKRAPSFGWWSWEAASVLMLAFALAGVFIKATWRSTRPVVDLSNLGDRNFAVACALSFILGVGLYGNVYLMPVFLAYVGGYDAFEVGQIMLVTGVAQLIAAPIVVMLENRVDARLLSIFGFCLLAAGFALSIDDTPRTGFDEMLVPQIVRGFAIMLCLLPPTRIALGALPEERVPDASALFNLMRNLGGAIGIALIDSLLFGRAPGHGIALAERLLNREADAFSFVGLPQPLAETFITEQMKEMARPAVERAALTLAAGDAWLLLASFAALGAIAALAIQRTELWRRG